MKAGYLASAVVLLTGLNATDVFAHAFSGQPVDPVDVDAVINIDGNTFQLDLFVPVAPLMDSPSNSELIRVQKERYIKLFVDLIKRTIRIKFTGPGSRGDEPELVGWADTDVSLLQTSHVDEESGATVPTWVARLEGAVPKEALNLHVSLGPAAIRLYRQINFVARYGGGAVERVVTKEASETETILPARGSSLEVTWRYIALGFLHIIPKGLDHILFVLGLFLLSTSLRTLLWQISAFTLAHSVTLGLSMAGVWQMPGEVVEPIIAASIVYVAVENIYTAKLTPWRPALVFVFGLLHGLGFAGVLSEIGMPTDAFFTALLAFNIGVEVGQLSVIAIAFALVFWIRNRPSYRQWVVVPASSAIALVGIYWTIERIFF